VEVEVEENNNHVNSSLVTTEEMALLLSRLLPKSAQCNAVESRTLLR
jgi:hypothetical protein